MIRAYDEILSERAAGTLGGMLDFAVRGLHMDISAVLSLFAASNTASRFEAGDIRLIAGMSGAELAYEVLDSSGIAYERAAPRRSQRPGSEYWYGYALALTQWRCAVSFSEAAEALPAADFIAELNSKRRDLLEGLPLDLSDSGRTEALSELSEAFASEACEAFEKRRSERSAGVTPLKKARIKSGLSQSGLAKAAGIPVRTLQQYEQRQKELSRARSDYLISLSRALGCDPASLLEANH